MECRTPLSLTVSNNPQAQQQQQLGVARYQNRTPQPKPPPPVKRRLPLPKNVVLLSLIEATELAAEDVRRNEQQQHQVTQTPTKSINPDDENDVTKTPDTTIHRTTSLLDRDDYDEDDEAAMDDDEQEFYKIQQGTSLAISECGTYAVACREGLEIYPSRPQNSQSRAHAESQEDVENLVRFFHQSHDSSAKGSGGEAIEVLGLDYSKSSEESTASVADKNINDGDAKMPPSPSGAEAQDSDLAKEAKTDDPAAAAAVSNITNTPTKSTPPIRLHMGDRVQIVSIEKGWAKLSRGYGFVRAEQNQLVKGKSQ